MTTPVREDKNQQENEEDIDEEERYRSRAEYLATRIKNLLAIWHGHGKTDRNLLAKYSPLQRSFKLEGFESVEEGVKEWKRLLKSISDDKTEVHVIRKIEEFMQSQEMKKLK